MIAVLGARAVGGALLAALLDGAARVAVLAWLWGNPLGAHELFARLFGFAFASACVLSLGHALATALARATRAEAPAARALAAMLGGLAGQALALAALRALCGPAGQADLELPLASTPAMLVFGAAVALGCDVAREHSSKCDPLRPALGGALAGALALAACHALLGEGTPGVACDPGVPGGAAAALLAAVCEGAALGAGLGLASGWVPRVARTARAARFGRTIAGVALLLALAIGVVREDALALVDRRTSELEPLVERVRAHPRFSDPLFARWLCDVRTREEKAADFARRLPWYTLRFPSSFLMPWRLAGPHAELSRIFDDAELILRSLLDEPVALASKPTAAAHLLKLVRGFRVPAALEYQEHFQRNVLTVHRGGVPLFALAVIAPDDPARRDFARDVARAWPITLPGGMRAQAFRRGTRNCVLAGDFIYEVWAPTEDMRLRVVERLERGIPLAPGDDLAQAAALIPAGCAPGGPAMAQARAWLASGLHPYFGDVHTHASSTLGGSVPPLVAAANLLGQFSHFHALTEHFSAIGNEPVARGLAAISPGSTFLPGEELCIGQAHLTALGITRWLPVPWFAFTAPPDAFRDRLLAQGAVPVLAHALYPRNDWQLDVMNRWAAHGFAAAESTPWMPDDFYESLPEPVPTLGGSDAHCGCFAGAPRTMLLARDGSAASLLEAIRAGRCLALRVDQRALSRGLPAMRAALWLLLSEPGRLERELAATWHGAELARRPVLRE